MDAVRFSVVIPTRERAATLRHAIATALDQTFDSYEIIVSDNDSSPATKAVVDEFASAKVRYFRTPRLLAMSSNWDFALAQARGEYVILIGDDDGLLPHALAELDRLTSERTAKVVRWESAYYTWPTFALPGHANYLRIPLGRGLREVAGIDVIRSVIAFQLPYSALPMLYNAAVHRSVLEELRAKAGRVFPHPVPDVYSGFAIAAVAGKFISTDVPMSIAGQSGASNGIAVLFRRGQSVIDREFRDLNAREGLTSDPRIPDLPAFPYVPVADSFAFAKRMFFPDAAVDLDRRQFVAGCVANLRVAGAGEWREALARLRESLADDPATREWFDAELANTPYGEPPPPRLLPERMGFDGESLHLRADEFGVADVASAAALCERILCYRESGVEYRDVLVQELRRVNAERQRLIDWLQGECETRLGIINELVAKLRGGPVKRAARWLKQRLTRLVRPRSRA
jgi:hypothetical protein